MGLAGVPLTTKATGVMEAAWGWARSASHDLHLFGERVVAVVALADAPLGVDVRRDLHLIAGLEAEQADREPARFGGLAGRRHREPVVRVALELPVVAADAHEEVGPRDAAALVLVVYDDVRALVGDVGD